MLVARYCIVILLLCCECTASASAADMVQLEKAFQAQIRPLIKQVCMECHSGAEPDGGLTLEHLDAAKSLFKQRRIWEKVIQRVQIGEMPPREGKPLSDPDRARFVSWLQVAINDIDCGRTPNPGRVTLRRLNRHEYRNTVFDLVGVDFKPADSFPGDDVGYGFDNIGDVLTLPPLLMEKYVKAAEEIAGQAIIAPEPFSRFEPTHIGSQLTPSSDGVSVGDGRMNLYSSGYGELTEQIPWPGSYRIEVDVTADQAGNEPAKLLISVDGKRIRELAAKGKSDVPPQTLSQAVSLKAGKRTFRFEFTNDFYQKEEGGRPQLDRNLYIHSVRLIGKQEPKPLDENKLPASHRELVFAKPDGRTTPEKAARKVLGRLASRAYRRPVTPDELDRLTELADSVRESESYEAGLQTGLMSILVSPHFLFKVEQGAGVALEKYAHLSDYELATRLSYFLWSTMPDDRLLLAAFKQELHKPDVLAAEIKRMIADRRSSRFINNFAGQWLTLPKLGLIAPNVDQFPQWNDQLRELLRRETLTFVAGVMRDDMSVLTLIDADFSYLNEQLANYYGIRGVKGEDFRKVSTKSSPRRGLLTQGAILAVTSNPTRTSPVKRGKWILDNLLGTPPPSAPPNIPELEKSALKGTLRERMEQHRVDPACASCHKLMDPLGFAMENYDAIGRWRTQDGSEKINATGTLPDGTTVNNAGELIGHIRNQQSEKFVRCLTEKMLTFAIGRGLEYYDKCAVDKIVANVKADDHRFSSLVTQIVLSDPFLRYGEREEP